MNCVNMIFSITAINLLIKHQKNEPENFLSKIGNRTIGIFFIHMLIKKIINKLITLFKLNKLLTNQLLYILIITFLIYFISYIIIEVFSKITKGKFDTVLGFK